ncbi:MULTISPECIES: hypothetical protein [unclassified Rickettsia]
MRGRSSLRGGRSLERQSRKKLVQKFTVLWLLQVWCHLVALQKY